MRKYSALIVVLCLALIFSTPFPLSGQNGVYNTFSGLYWCSDHAACLHEIGHKLDQQSGWASRSAEFGDTLKVFILAQARLEHPSPFLYKLFSMPDFNLSEIYAQLFLWSEGRAENMPESFRKFYNWDEAHALLQRDGR